MFKRPIHSLFYPFLLLIASLTQNAVADQVVTTQLTAAQAPTGGVRSVEVSPDNSRVVYLANQEVSDRYELYSRPVAGGPITKLNPSLPVGGTVESFGITADSSRVVFVADPNQAGSYELFSVPLAGGTVTSLSGLPVDGGDVVSWQLDPAGSRVAFVADQAVDEVFELYSVAVGGGTPVRLAGPSESGGSERPSEWLITLDGSRVAFVADHDSAGLDDLYTVPLTGGAVVKLSGDFTAGISSDLISSPDGSRLIFAGDLNSPFDHHLFSVPAAGGAVTRLTPEFLGVQGVREYRISPDSSRAVYVSDHEQSNVYQIYSVPIAGGTVVRLNDPLVSLGNVWYPHFLIDPVTERVVYRADQDIDGVNEFYSAPLTGGGSTKIHENLVVGEWTDGLFELAPGGNVVFRAARAGQQARIYRAPILGGTMFNLTSDLSAADIAYGPGEVAVASNRVLYAVQQSGESYARLFSVTLAGDSPAALSLPPVEGSSSVISAVMSPDDTQLFYRSRQDSGVHIELYQVAVTGAVPQKVNGPITAVGGSLFAGDVQVSEPAGRAVALAEHHDLDQTELYSAALDGSSSIRLTGDLPDFADAHSFTISPDGQTVVFRADPNQDNVFELFSVPIQGGPFTRLNGPLSGNTDVDRTIQISPDSATVYFSVRDVGLGASELFSVPITGGAPTSLATGETIARLTLDAERGYLLFLEGPSNDKRLFHLPATGGTPVELNAPLEITQRVEDFLVSRDGLVVYRVDSSIVDAQSLRGLYSVPVTGGEATAISDSDNIWLGSWFNLTPDHSRVLFLGSGGLYSTPIQGPLPTLLSAADAHESTVILRVRISPDSNRVVYQADQETDLVYELFSVPTTGGTPVKLHPDLNGTQQQAGTFEISPDSSTVVFRSNYENVAKFELFSSPIDGGGSTRITPDFPEPRAWVERDFQISHAGGHVFYRKAASNANSTYDLFRVPIGGGEALRLHPEPVSGGSQQLQGSVQYGFTVTSDDSRVVFAGDLAVRGVDELWSSTLPGLFCDGFESGDTSAWSFTTP